MHATVVPPPELRREPTTAGEAFSFRWTEKGHLGMSAIVLVMSVLVWAVADAVWREPRDVGMVATLIVLAAGDLLVVWATAAGLLNRTTITFEHDCMWLWHGPVVIVHRGRMYARNELRDFAVREILLSRETVSQGARYRYVLTASTADGRTFNLTREVTPYYRPALTYLAYHGNAWLNVVASDTEESFAEVASG